MTIHPMPISDSKQMVILPTDFGLDQQTILIRLGRIGCKYPLLCSIRVREGQRLLYFDVYALIDRGFVGPSLHIHSLGAGILLVQPFVNLVLLLLLERLDDSSQIFSLSFGLR